MIINFKGNDIEVKERLSLAESLTFVDSVVSNVVSVEEKTYTPLFLELSIHSNFITYFTNLEVPHLEELHADSKDYIDLIERVRDSQLFDGTAYDKLITAIDDEIYTKRQMLIHKNSFDDVAESLNTLLSTLNEKAKELDMKKLEKLFKKLNPQEILKAYQKSGIGEGERDKAIQELAKENIALKNEISARNVKVDK